MALRAQGRREAIRSILGLEVFCIELQSDLPRPGRSADDQKKQSDELSQPSHAHDNITKKSAGSRLPAQEHQKLESLVY
jgi:hypothetical protein